jgi:sigma-54 specific flagellar transcriptional regulator A
VLEEGMFMRLGGTKVIHTAVRTIAATDRHLKEAVKSGEFREDSTVASTFSHSSFHLCASAKKTSVPPALDVMVHLNTELKKNFVGFTPAAAELMKDYPWSKHPRAAQRGPAHHDSLHRAGD